MQPLPALSRSLPRVVVAHAVVEVQQRWVVAAQRQRPAEVAPPVVVRRRLAEVAPPVVVRRRLAEEAFPVVVQRRLAEEVLHVVARRRPSAVGRPWVETAVPRRRV